MKTMLAIAAIFLAGCSSQQTPETSHPDSPPASNVQTRPAQSKKSPNVPAKSASSTIQPLNPKQQEQLLGARLQGGMGYSFRQFANMFLVSSRLRLGVGVGLMTSSKEIAQAQLQSPFPTSYQPTLRELLDSIALQTSSQWKYDPTSKYFQSEVEHDKPVEGIAIFEFTKAKRKKPFEVVLADGWKALDKGNWVMHVPPSFPVGMDIYEMGTYSTDDKTFEKDFLQKIRSSVALEWAQRVNKQAVREDLKPSKVGAFDALYYESMVPSQFEKEIKWRQWVFMVNNKCYFVVSTILPEFEAKIFPDVEKMLSSFRVEPR